MRLSGIPCINCNPGQRKHKNDAQKRGIAENIMIYVYVNHLPVDIWKDDRSQGGNLRVGQVT
jgi:hypothetical protein